ncbi:MAG: ATP-binding protein, partial [Gemmatimonadota bacterium]
KLIDDLLSYSRVETHGKPFEEVDAKSAFDWAITNLEVALEQSGGLVTCDELPRVTAEPTQLGQLFQNLISNAIKYGPEERTEIHVGAVREEDGWRFSVSDNGVGIAGEDLERVFELFRRLESGSSEPGTGVGLAVCTRIVGRHGGRIWAKSEPGQGSTFYFTLPDQGQTPA